MALRKGVDFLAFYDGDEFIGINYGESTGTVLLDSLTGVRENRPR